jgi:hypothetical protein
MIYIVFHNGEHITELAAAGIFQYVKLNDRFSILD